MAAHQDPILIESADLLQKVPLDRAGFGNVFLCHHKTHGQVVQKTVYTGPLRGNNKAKLLKEAKILHKLNHSRIVKLFGVVLEDGAHSLVKEFVTQGNLLALLETVTVPISVKGRIILEMLEGMEYLTRNGIIHKDLKPENILVDGEFHIKIDVGLATCQAWTKLTREESRRQSRNGVSCSAGNLFYMAPEHLQNINTPFTEKSDVYSFAIIVWVILTNMEPYECGQREQVYFCVCNGNRPDEGCIPPTTPPKIMTLMKDCWHQQPSKRPGFAESSKAFLCFYRDELGKSIEKDLQELVGQYARADVVKKISSLALGNPHPQAAKFHVGGDWCGSTLQADARATHGSFISSPDLSTPSTPSRANSVEHQVLRHSMSTPGISTRQPSSRQDFLAHGMGAPMRERKPTAVPPAECCASCQCSLSPLHLADQHNQRRSWPEFPEQHPTANSFAGGAFSSSMLGRQGSGGLYIQYATGIQVGDYNQLRVESENISEDSFQPSTSNSSFYQELLCRYEDRPVKKEQLDLLSENIGKKWKCCARSLGLNNVEVETISYDYALEGLREMVYQMLQKWQMKQGLVGCTIGPLCRALKDHVGVDLLCQLLQMY
ncbi:hypothetical protein AGOR_G00176840 [Albula goreensis]|uniref:Receptor-interacting serine/threonine-protein kinase 1 n=1 Tax=Albula goreensis TaxID=1534307 RepID=A0A8T3D0I8_9TELE|nr:hypothetical protein AGOR_G00176840 [Albula goreensis]